MDATRHCNFHKLSITLKSETFLGCWGRARIKGKKSSKKYPPTRFFLSNRQFFEKLDCKNQTNKRTLLLTRSRKSASNFFDKGLQHQLHHARIVVPFLSTHPERKSLYFDPAYMGKSARNYSVPGIHAIQREERHPTNRGPAFEELWSGADDATV